MKFSDWKALSADERKAIKWRHRPHVKAGTVFMVAIVLVILLFIARVGKNETRHLNTKPSGDQAYSMAQNFVKDKLKLPASADFPKNKYDVDTSSDTYVVNGTVNAQSADGQFVKQQWTARMKFLGGDWSERKSWQVDGVEVK